MNSDQQSAQQFWVVGGQYADMAFREMRGAPEAHGPFASYESARQAWASQASRTRSDACTRYTSTATPARA